MPEYPFKRGDLIVVVGALSSGATVWRYLGRIGTHDNVVEWSGEGESPYYAAEPTPPPERLWRLSRPEGYVKWTPKPVKDEVWRFEASDDTAIVKDVTDDYVIYQYSGYGAFSVRTREEFAEKFTKVPDGG